MLGKYFCLNGQFLPVEQAKINIDNIEFSYGFGVYENLRIRNGKVMFLDEHVERLFISAGHIGLECDFKLEEIKQWILEVVERNQPKADQSADWNCNIKMLLIGGVEPKLYIFMLAPKFLDKKYYKQGVKVISYNYERWLPQAKTLNMLPSYLIFREIKKQDAYDALLVDKKGFVPEGTRSNFFVIKNKTLYTTPVEKVLDGVTRRTVIECALQNGYKCIEKEVKLENIFNHDGAFLTSTSGKIVPIKKIDNKSFNDICVELKDLIKFYNNYLEKYV